MRAVCVSSAEKFYVEAKNKLEEKDFIEFLANISKAELSAENENGFIAKVMFLKVQGLFKFNEFRKALSIVDEAIECTTGRDTLKLRNYKGVMLGYIGELEAGKAVLEALIDEVPTVDILVEAYLNLAWVYGTMYSHKKERAFLEGLKKYVDLANAHFEALDNKIKGKLLDSLSFYHYCTGNYAEAIALEENAANFLEEKELPKIYNNLAAMYLEFDKREGLNCVSIKGREYMHNAEILGDKYHDTIEVAKSFYNQALALLQEEQIFKALDTLHLALEHFIDAQALSLAFKCLLKISDIINEYNVERLTSLKESLKENFRGTSLFGKI